MMMLVQITPCMNSASIVAMSASYLPAVVGQIPASRGTNEAKEREDQEERSPKDPDRQRCFHRQ